jgi:hypothetical protein
VPTRFVLGAVAVLAAAGFLLAWSPASLSGRWHPGPVRSWAYVIGESYPLTIPPLVAGKAKKVQVVDADLGDQSGLRANGVPRPSAAIEHSVKAIHAMGAHAVCYVDAGTTENWRSDRGKFDPSEVGRPLPGWQGERFVDVAKWSAAVPQPYEKLSRILSNRISLCKKEGFDAIEADNLDAYTYGNLGGFKISMRQEESFIEHLVTVAHRDGLAFFLKNEINGDSLLRTVAPHVDGEIDEQCWQYAECSVLKIFVTEHKPILNVEYRHVAATKLCPKARAFPMATIEAPLDLSGRIIFACF